MKQFVPLPLLLLALFVGVTGNLRAGAPKNAANTESTLTAIDAIASKGPFQPT